MIDTIFEIILALTQSGIIVTVVAVTLIISLEDERRRNRR